MHDEDSSAPEAEELSVDNRWRGAVAGWFPRRWQSWVAALLILCLGLGAGTVGTYAWIRHQRQQRPRIEATLFETQTSGAGGRDVPIEVRVRNAGHKTVTVDKVRLSVPGFKIKSGGFDETKKLSPHETTDISYQLTPDCDTDAKGPARVRARTHGHGQQKRWTTEAVPRHAPDAVGDLGTAHLADCSKIAGIQMKMRHASTSGDVLTMRVRLGATAPPSRHGHQKTAKNVRLSRLASEDSPGMIRVSFHAPGRHGSKSTKLPADATVRVRVSDCDWALNRPARMRASVQALGDAGDIAVEYDAKTAARILSFTTDRCS